MPNTFPLDGPSASHALALVTMTFSLTHEAQRSRRMASPTAAT